MNVTANPWLADSWNLTDQGSFIKKFGLAVAQRRMNEAGVKLGALRPAGQSQVSNKVYVIQGKPGRDGAGANVSPTELLGFSAEGPFAANEQFGLALAQNAVKYPGVEASAKSRAFMATPPSNDFVCVLTNDVIDYLSNGTSILCTVTFLAGQTHGTFVYGTPTIIPNDVIPWVIITGTPDAQAHGIQIVFVGDRQ